MRCNPTLIWGYVVGVLIALTTAHPTRADVVLLEARSGGVNFDKTSIVGAFPNGWQTSGTRSSATGLTPGIGSYFQSNAGIGGDAVYFQVAPILGTPGGEYLVEITHQSGNAGANVLSNIIIVSGGSGLPSQTAAFNSAVSNQWELVGTLQLAAGETTPTIRFTEAANDNRFYWDAVRFTLVPEPASLALMSMVPLALLTRRRRI